MQRTTRNKTNSRNPVRRTKYVNKKIENSTNNIAKMNINNKVDMTLIIVVLMLVLLGIVMILSASAPSALSKTDDSYFYMRKQAIAAVLGFAAMFLASKIDYKIFKKFYKIIYPISILILFTVLIPGLKVDANGAARWIKVAGMQIQPSEITKIGLIVYFAGYFSDRNNKLDTFWGGCLKPLIAIAIPVLILYKVQNHMSAGIIITFVSLVIMVMGGCKLKYLFSLGGAGLLGAGGIFLLFKDKLLSGAASSEGGFRAGRIEAWLNPWENTSGTAYQTVQGLYAIGSGGLFGVGLGESKQKYLYIPEAHNDFIFAILAEELGFVGCVAVLALFAVLIVRGVVISMKSEDMFGSLLAIGITALIAIQTMLNIAVVTNTIPNTGVSLPFLSYGGSSLMILLGCMGILLSISKTAKKI